MKGSDRTDRTDRTDRNNRTNVLLFLEIYINNLSGTDGLRLRCRQFYTSSDYPPRPFPRSCKKSLQKWLLSQFQNNEGLVREKYPMVSQSMNGRLSLPGSLIMYPTTPLRKITTSHDKPSVVWYKRQSRRADTSRELHTSSQRKPMGPGLALTSAGPLRCATGQTRPKASHVGTAV